MKLNSSLFLLCFGVFETFSLKTHTAKRRHSIANKVKSEKSSLAFVFDTTGSMHDDLTQLREGAEMILKTALEESDVIANFVFVPFHDPKVGPPTVTRNIEVFKKALNVINVYGGGDCPENSLGGIMMALSVSHPRSFLYVLTDATAADHRLVDKVLDLVQRKQSQVVFVLTGHCQDLHKPSYQVYQQIAAASSGQIFNLNKTSVHEVLEFVKNSIKGRTVNLISVVKPAGHNYTQGIPVDKSVGEVTVSVSGANPHIRVVDPNDEEITGPPKLVKILDLSEIMVVKVLDPEPGTWNISVGSEKNYSVKVVGLSNLTFNYGFSLDRPKSMAETGHRPLKKTYNHMILTLSDTDSKVKLDYAEIISLEGKTLFEIPLIADASNIYRASEFMPPDDFFYIAINGHDENNQEFRRVGTTAVQAKIPEVPYLTSPRKIEARAHSRVVLSCKVESMVPVTAHWSKKPNEEFQETSSLHTYTIEHIIEDMKEENVGTFVCNAHNGAGVTKRNTRLVLLVDPPEVLIAPENITLEVGDNLNVTCTAISEALLLKHLLLFKGNNMENTITESHSEPNMEGYYPFSMIVSNVTENNTGNYTCLATNRGGEVNRTTFIRILSKPKSKIIGSNTIITQLNTNERVACHVDDAESIQWVAPNGSVVRERSVNGSCDDILDVESVNDGIWTCVALRGRFNASDSVQITVHIKPQVNIIGSKNITILNGTTFEIICEVLAKPPPKVVWDMKTIKKLDFVISSIGPNLYRSVLKLDSRKEQINGTYFCIGENTNETSMDSVRVHVRRKMFLRQGFSDQKIKMYSPLKLQCDVDSYPPPIIKWYHSGIELKNNAHINISQDNSFLEINIMNISDFGKYSCVANNEFEIITVNADVTKLVDPPQVFIEPGNTVLDFGEYLNITGNTISESPLLTYRLVFKGNKFEKSSDVQPELNADGKYAFSVIIRNVSENFSGNYSCSATNEGGEMNKTIVIKVNSKPNSQILGPHTISSPLHSDVQLVCHVEKAESMQWLAPNGSIVMNQKTEASSDFVLNLKNVCDDGRWTCVAQNGKVNASDSVQINVQIKPRVAIIGPKNVTILNGTIYEIHCEILAKPLPRVIWHKETEQFLDCVTTSLGSNLYRSVLQLDSSKELVQGTYFCIGENAEGISQDSVTVQVRTKLILLHGMNDTRTKLYSQLNLHCNVDSHPPPIIKWYHNGIKLENNENTHIFAGNTILKIKSMNTSDFGQYSCMADDGYDKIVINTTVTKLVNPPEIYIEPGNKTLDEGNELNITCTAFSESLLLKYRLNFKGNNFENSSEVSPELNTEGKYSFSVIIRNISEKYAGNYSCSASNEAGESNKTIMIKVNAKPNTQILGPHTISSEIHSDVQLVCHVDRAESMQWIAPNGSVVVNQTVKLSSDFVLNVRNVSEDGTWTCLARRGKLNVSDSVQINIKIKPSVKIIGSKSITILNGSIYEINCEILAKPIPRVIWHRETEEFLDCVTTSVGHNLYKSVLKLDSSKEQVQDTYFCIGENSEGISEDSVTVQIRRKMFLLHDFNDITTQLYSQIKLQCDVDSYPPPTLKWYHNGTELQKNENIDLSKDSSVLLVKKMDFSNFGRYTCVAENGYETMSYNATVTVTGLELPQLSKETKNVVVRKGDTTNITCRIFKGNPEPTVSWMFKNVSAKDFSTFLVDYTDQNKIVLSEISLEQSGTYRCKVENVIGSDTHDTQLVVQYAPQSIVPSEWIENVTSSIEIGKKVTFSCNTTGSPTPIVVWTKNGLPVAFSKNVYLIEPEILVIDNVTEHNAGLYSCNVSNALGSIHRNFTLKSYATPKILPSSLQPVQQFLEGQLVELPCRSKGVPIPEVLWKHNDEAIHDDRRQIDENGIRFVANITDFGNYSCVASNEYGNDSITYSVLVWVAPSIDPPLRLTKQVFSGDNVTVQCDVVGFPIPDVTWEYGGNVISENTTTLSYNEYGNLYLTNITLASEGAYGCVASNIAGVAIKTTFIVVNEPPKILDDNYTGPYVATEMDRSLSLYCAATGKPKPYVLWYKDGFYLNHDPRYNIDVNGRFEIIAPKEELSGNYTCVAWNNYGNGNKTFEVLIYSVPKQIQSDETLIKVGVVEGSDVNILCPVRGSNINSIKWYKDAKLVSSGNLVIKNISRDNTSVLACVATNTAGSALAYVALDVQWPPAFLMTVDENVEVIKEDDLLLNCGVNAKPIAKVKWLYNSKPLIFENKDMLKLLKIQQRNAGVYKCIVSNIHGTIFREFNVSVLEPPFLLEFHFLDVLLKKGSNATLDCIAKGTPTPAIKWTYNNTNWQSDGIAISSNNITEESEGLYRCDATNKAGNAHMVYRIIVVAAPHIVDITSFTDGQGTTVNGTVEIILNKQARISCKAKGKPIPTIQWIKNGKVVGQNQPDLDYANLFLDNVQNSNAGIYTCVATNEGGSDENKMKIDVLEPPHIFHNIFQSDNITNNVINLEVISGQAFYLHCHPTGNPWPEIYWFRDDLPLIFYDETMVSTEFSEVIVSKSALLEQSGNYTCIVKNKVGNNSASYVVDVLVPPPIPKEKTRMVSARLGQSVELKCPVEGSPLPDVMWIKHPYTEIDKNAAKMWLMDENITLILNNTEISDSGKYSCIMTNKVGTTEVEFDLTVLKAPFIAANERGDFVEDHVLSLKRSIVLKCEADGHPAPKITWLKDTQQLSDSASNIRRVAGNSLLAIVAATSRDAAQYICIAENDAGTAHRRYNIAVQVPGKWSDWSRWSYCNVTCGPGYQTRSRSCQYIDDYNNIIDKTSQSDKIILDETKCKGPDADKRKCQMPSCEEAEDRPKWSVWSAWSTCSASCGAGTQTRTRRCTTKLRCTGDNVQVRNCPSLPKCKDSTTRTENDGLHNTQHREDNEVYIPEAVYEMQPEIIKSKYSPDVEHFYVATETKRETVSFDVNVTSNLDRSEQGRCDPGYTYNRTTDACHDIDECQIKYNECHASQYCANTAGGYRCGCPSGYLALGVGQRCLDINECVQNIAGCEYACVNTAGGYVCACPKHLRLHIDKHRCVPASVYNDPNYKDDSEELSSSNEYPMRYRRNGNK